MFILELSHRICSMFLRSHQRFAKRIVLRVILPVDPCILRDVLAFIVYSVSTPSLSVIGVFCSRALRCGRRSTLPNRTVNVDFERLETNEIFLMGGSHTKFSMLPLNPPTETPAEDSAGLSEPYRGRCAVLEPLPMLAVDRSWMCPYSVSIPSRPGLVALFPGQDRANHRRSSSDRRNEVQRGPLTGRPKAVKLLCNDSVEIWISNPAYWLPFRRGCDDASSVRAFRKFST
jgi:hypothetical protein